MYRPRRDCDWLLRFVSLKEYVHVIRLHVKIDFETGKKYAKLLDHNNNEPTDIIIVDKDDLVHSEPVQIESSEVDTVDTSQDAQVNIHHEDSLITFPVIPPGHKENLRISHSDNLLFEECVSKLTTTPQSLHDIISTLDSLEDL
ncbi:15125_t:CDS:2, partial [Racocetra persica]